MCVCFDRAEHDRFLPKSQQGGTMEPWRSNLFELAVGGVIGYIVGVLKPVLSDWITDKRRKRAAEKASRKKFRDLEGQMGDLIPRLRENLAIPERANTREFLVIPNRNHEWPRYTPGFPFYESEIQDLANKVRVLENHGYVQDVRTGEAPRYRMTEEFVAMIRSAS